MAPKPDAVIGQTLGGKYRVVERVGSDAISRVYRAVGDGDTAVSVRVMHAWLAASEVFAKRFVQAAQLGTKLSHPGVLQVIDAGIDHAGDAELLFEVVELFEGRNLHAIAYERGLLPPAKVSLLGVQILEALEHAHSTGVTHLDLNPDNVLIGVDSEGAVRPKVCDFGLGRLASEVTCRVTLLGSSLAVPCYLAPEQARGEDSGVRADVYAVGALMYELLTGTPLYGSVSPVVFADQQVSEEPEPPRQRAPERGIGAMTEAVVMQALRKDPAHRFGSARAMREALSTSRHRDSGEAASGVVSVRGSRGSVLMSAVSAGKYRKGGMIARDDLLELLRNIAIAPALSVEPAGRVAILLAGAGMGKSALLDETVAALRGGPIEVVRLEGRLSGAVPLEPFAQLARDLLGIKRGAEQDCIDRASAFLASKVGLAEEDISRLMDRLTARKSALAVSPEVLEREETAALRYFFGRALAGMHTTFIAEDADLLDPASSRLVLDLMEAAASRGLSVIATARSDPWPDWTASHVIRVHVPELDAEASVMLVRDRLGHVDVPVEVIDRGVQWAKGTPLRLDLFAQAIRMSAPGGDGGVRSAVGQDLEEGTRGVVDAVMRAADREVRAWLRCASLVGIRVAIALIEAWAPASMGSVALLRMCQNTGLVRVHGDCIVFRNEAVRGAIRDRIAQRDRREMHQAIATWMAEGTPPRGPAEQVASHLEAAGVHDQAAAIFEKAGVELMARKEPRSAASMFRRAFSAWMAANDTAAATKVGHLHAESLLQASDARGASEVLAKLERMGAPSHEGLRARVYSRIASAQGDPELAVKTLSRASDRAVDALDQESWLLVESDLASLLSELGRNEEAEGHALLAHELSISMSDVRSSPIPFGDSTRVSQTAAFVADLRVRMGRVEDARTVLQLALENAAAHGDEAAASRVLANLAYLAARENKHSLAVELAERAIGFAHRTGDRMAAARISINIGSYCLKMGEMARAVDSFDKANQLSRAIGWRQGMQLTRDTLRKLSNKQPAPSNQ